MNYTRAEIEGVIEKNKMREEFEHSELGKGCVITRHEHYPEEYAHSAVQALWVGYQAGRNYSKGNLMSNTREIKAVSKAIERTTKISTIKMLMPSGSYITTPGLGGASPNNTNDIAQAAIAASDSKYIKGLVGALKSIAKNTCCDKCQEAALVAHKALQQLPEDLR